MALEVGGAIEGIEGGVAVDAGTAGAAGAGAGGAGAGSGTAAAGGGLGASAAKIGANFAISYAVANLFNRGSSIAHPDAQSFLGNGYSSLDPIPVLYGARRIGGSRAMLAVDSSANQNNDVLHLAMIWGEGEIQSLRTVYLDGEVSTDENGRPVGRFVGYMQCEHVLGTDGQAANPSVSVFLGPKAKFSGIAYSHVVLGWTPDLFPNGRPTITVDYQGRKLYDPRTGLTAYSNNPALVIRDYLTNQRYGCRAASSMIDDTSFSSAADYCDVVVGVPNYRVASLSLNAAGAGYQVGDVIYLDGGIFSAPASVVVDTVNGSGGITAMHLSGVGSYTTQTTVFTQSSSTAHVVETSQEGFFITSTGLGATFNNGTYTQDSQVRYTCDGVVNIDQTPFDNIAALLTACRGYLVFSGGKYKLKPDKADSAVSFVLSEDNIVGNWSFQGPSKRTRFNRVKARFFNADAGWTPDFAIWPRPDPVTGADPIGDAYRAADGGIILEKQIDLPYTVNVYRAMQIAQQELKRSRNPMLVQLTATIAATCLEVGDVVPVAHATPGWPAAGDPANGKLFRVVEMELLANDEVRLTLHEYQASAYTLDDLTVVAPVAETSLPDATIAAAPGTPGVVEALYETSGSAGVKSKATVSWGAAASIWVVRGGYYELEYKLSTSSTWTRISPISDTMQVLEDLAAGRYGFRVRSVNAAGVRSDYSATTTAELFGLTAAPSTPQNFAVQNYAGQAKFTWDRPTANTDLDVLIGGRAIIRWNPNTVGVGWNDGSLVNPEGYPGDTTIGFGPLMTGTYMLKFRDSSGNISSAPASFVVTEALLTGLTTIASITEHPAFTGAKTNTVAVDNILKLAGSTLWDSIPGNIDSWGMLDSIGGIPTTGSYAFSAKLDLGSVKTVRAAATIRSLSFNTADNWDDRTTPIDDWGLVDGDLVDDVEVTLYVRTTNDDPNAAPTWGAWHRLGFVGDYTARGFDLRLDFTSADPTHNRQVDQLSVALRQ